MARRCRLYVESIRGVVSTGGVVCPRELFGGRSTRAGLGASRISWPQLAATNAANAIADCVYAVDNQETAPCSRHARPARWRVTMTDHPPVLRNELAASSCGASGAGFPTRVELKPGGLGFENGSTCSLPKNAVDLISCWTG